MRNPAKLKLGFYPALPEIIEGVIRRLRFDDDPTQKTTILDPCCGEGTALLELQKAGKNNQGYGVELDASRAAKASQLGLTQVLNAPVEASRLSENSYSLAWVNPPYDHEVGGGRRQEVTFLRLSISALRQQGILVLLIPITILRQISFLLSGEFSEIQVYKGDPIWKQIVIIGRKERTTSFMQSRQRQKLDDLFDSFKTRGYENLSLPNIQEDPSPQSYWIVPNGDPEHSTIAFTKVSPDQLEEFGVSAKYNRHLNDTLTVPNPKTRLTPVTPLKEAHLANLLINGGLNGQVRKGPDVFVIAGSVRKSTIKKVDFDANDNEVETISECPQTFIVIADLQTGEVYDLET